VRRRRAPGWPKALADGSWNRRSLVSARRLPHCRETDTWQYAQRLQIAAAQVI
jgi:hypothetical protein